MVRGLQRDLRDASGAGGARFAADFAPSIPINFLTLPHYVELPSILRLAFDQCHSVVVDTSN